jgi:hypothetical protein
MKNQKIITATLLVVIFVTTFVTPVEAANTVRAIINNTTGQAVTLYLYGNESYTLELKLGKNKAELAKGTYRYYYYACGQEFFGQFEVKKVKDTLEVSCTATSSYGGVNTIQLTVNNKTPIAFWLTLTGDKPQRLYVMPGVNYFDIPQGTYKYNETICGKRTKGTLRATKGNPKINFKACKTIKIKIRNLTGSDLHLNLTGPVNYSFVLPPGTSNIKILPGTYSHYFWSSCSSGSGSHEWKGNGWIWTFWC